VLSKGAVFETGEIRRLIEGRSFGSRPGLRHDAQSSSATASENLPGNTGPCLLRMRHPTIHRTRTTWSNVSARR